jgi:Leucine-rich repeat (LRR) protein
MKGLEALSKLRILSLNGNKIEKIEGITHMIEVVNI